MSTQVLPASRFTVVSTRYLVPTESSIGVSMALAQFLTIGRDSSNMLQIQDPFASSRHARIEQRDGGYILRDLHSRNGTFVNGTKVMECQLTDNDRISFGQTEFIFSSQDKACNLQERLKTKNSAWERQVQQIPHFAKTNFPVLILGASGTGKEIVARAIHEQSERGAAPFVSVNCSALSENLVESELFGHTRGSFTGATHDRKGAFEAARGGTLFLDEVGDLPLALQPKLLRALENAEIRPVGSDRVIQTDVRVIAATHQNLDRKVQLGEFRSDLYYRLNVIKITPPKLRDRMEDFDDLVYEFARQMRVRFSHSAILKMREHSWPGNVRELRNVVARSAACFPGIHIQPQQVEMLIDALPPGDDLTRIASAANASIPLIKEIEREMIRARLLANQGNQRKTAIELGIPKSTLHDRIKSYKIDIRQLLLGS